MRNIILFSISMVLLLIAGAARAEEPWFLAPVDSETCIPVTDLVVGFLGFGGDVTRGYFGGTGFTTPEEVAAAIRAHGIALSRGSSSNDAFMWYSYPNASKPPLWFVRGKDNCEDVERKAKGK